MQLYKVIAFRFFVVGIIDVVPIVQHEITVDNRCLLMPDFNVVADID